MLHNRVRLLPRPLNIGHRGHVVVRLMERHDAERRQPVSCALNSNEIPTCRTQGRRHSQRALRLSSLYHNT